jgi:hypothetical protein
MDVEGGGVDEEWARLCGKTYKRTLLQKLERDWGLYGLGWVCAGGGTLLALCVLDGREEVGDESSWRKKKKQKKTRALSPFSYLPLGRVTVPLEH